MARNALSASADGLYEALERAGAIYRANFPGRPLRAYRTPPLQVTTPAVWIGLPTLAYAEPFVVINWPVLIAVDGDQPEQSDTLYEVIGRVWDEVGLQSGFNADNVQPTNINLPGTEGPTNLLACIITVEATVAARTFCPTEMADYAVA